PPNTGFKQLPHEIFIHILSFLNRADLAKTFFVDNYWQRKTVEYAKKQELDLLTKLFKNILSFIELNPFKNSTQMMAKLNVIIQTNTFFKAQSLSELAICLTDA